MKNYGSIFWKRSPFVKFVLALITGIFLQWYLQVNITAWIISLASSVILLVSFSFIPLFTRFRYAFISGLIIMSAFISLGAILTWEKDIRNNHIWFGKNEAVSKPVVVTLLEPVSEKPNSYKAIAEVNYVLEEKKWRKSTGKIIIYFQKDPATRLNYGTRLLFKETIKEIRNSGNPGAFDYKRYCLFQRITHQVYLRKDQFELLALNKGTAFREFIFGSRDKILSIIRNNIIGEKETGLAEALLIGYKDDLDKTLVQSYSNTGVIHVIAISGLHLGLIYFLLALLTKPLLRNNRIKWLRPVIIITCLWLFSILAGAQPSILRAAVMFTCIVLGEHLSRKGSIYNTMAISAFVLLCINPYWLWDAGFQLSYAAVLSIILFMQPVYHSFFIKNKFLDLAWKMNAVTLAAQVLTIPFCIFHFHQFPNLFLLTNFIAVPLSSLVLLGEILLCSIAFLEDISLFLGKILGWLIGLMNTSVEEIEKLPFSVSSGLQISFVQALLLFGFITGTCYWIYEKSPPALKYALLALTGFICLRSISLMESRQQELLIVYNIPKKSAIDLVSGNKHLFIGDSDLKKKNPLSTYHLQPTRTLFRVSPTDTIQGFHQERNSFSIFGKRILALKNETAFQVGLSIPVDYLLVSGKPRISLQKLRESFIINQVILDSSVPAWTAQAWKKNCDSLQIPCHDVATMGAFVMTAL